MIIYVAMACSKILVDYQEALVNEGYYCACILINVCTDVLDAFDLV